MIQSFGDRQTEHLFAREPVPSLDARIVRVALRKLRQIDAACRLEDLRIPPGNRSSVCAVIVRGSTVSESTISGESALGGATLVQKGLRSLTTTKIAPIHPGEVLMEDFIEGFGITQHKLAVAIGSASSYQ